MSDADAPEAGMPGDDVPEQFRIRQAKRQRLLDEGRDAYPVAVPRTHSLSEVRAAYQRRFRDHLATVRQLALAAGCDYRLVSTAAPYLQTLGGFLVERAG